MELDFFAILQDSKTIYLYDISRPGIIPGGISNMELTLDCSKLPYTPYSFDVMSYLLSQRESNEFFKITSDNVGISGSQILPDGVYTMKFTINGHYSKTHKFLVYQNIKTEVDTLISESEYKVNIGDYNMTYVNDEINDKYDIEKVRYVKALYDKLLLYTQEPNEVEVNNLLNKLNRMLTIINT